MYAVLQDIRYAGRTLSKAPGFTSVVILVLAVGIGANVAMFGTMSRTFLRPLPYPEPEQLVLGRATFDGTVNPMASAYDYVDYRDRSQSFASLSALTAFLRRHTITGADEPERIPGVYASVDLFRTLGINPQVGRHFTSDEGVLGAPQVVIISHAYWLRRFGGTPDAVGRSLTIDGQPHTIVGVMPAGFRFMFDVDLWRPMRIDGPFAGARRWHNWLMVGRLRPGTTITEAQSEADVISAQLASEYPETNRTKALLLTELHKALVEDSRLGMLLLVAAVGLVLLIACGNVAGLLLARGSARRGELAVRAALGAPRLRLVRQLLTENVVIAITAGVLGTVLAIWLQGIMTDLTTVEYLQVTGTALSLPVLGFAVTLSLATGLVFGILPALRGARADVIDDLKAGARTTDAGGTRFRAGLVIAQVALSLMLLIGSGLLIRSFARLSSVDPGFDAENLLTAGIQLPSEYGEVEQRIQFFTALRERVRGLPGVEAVALINQLPIRNPANNTYVFRPDQPPGENEEPAVVNQRTVLPGYFEAMGIPLLQGRSIEESDRAGVQPVLVINEETARRFFPGESPIGRQLVVDWGQQVTVDVVGVVADVRQDGIARSPRLAMYGSYFQRPFYTMSIAVRTGAAPATVTQTLREALRELDPDIPLAEVATMDDLIRDSTADRRLMAASVTLFAVVALLLAAVGLYGVLAYYVSRRVHEIGLRVALGASAQKVVTLILQRGLALVAIGLGLGLVGAFGTTRFLEQMLYDLEPTDPTTFVGVSALFTVIGLVACLVPAWRAVRVNPVIALQAE